GAFNHFPQDASVSHLGPSSDCCIASLNRTPEKQILGAIDVARGRDLQQGFIQAWSATRRSPPRVREAKPAKERAYAGFRNHDFSHRLRDVSYRACRGG